MKLAHSDCVETKESEAPNCLMCTDRMEPFNASIYSGYEPQRTHPASFRGEPPSTTGARYYIFTLDGSIQVVDPRQQVPQTLDGARRTRDERVRAYVIANGRCKLQTKASYEAGSSGQENCCTADEDGLPNVLSHFSGREEIQRTHELSKAREEGEGAQDEALNRVRPTPAEGTEKRFGHCSLQQRFRAVIA